MGRARPLRYVQVGQMPRPASSLSVSPCPTGPRGRQVAVPLVRLMHPRPSPPALDGTYLRLRPHIYELWNFRQTSTTLFKDYINTWIKVKQEADGWPSPEVEKYPALPVECLEEFRRVEGVILDPAKIERNEG